MQELIRKLYFVWTHWQMQLQIKSFLTITFNPHIWWPTVPAWLSGREHFSGWWGWSATLSPGWWPEQMDSGLSKGEKGCKARCFFWKRKRLQEKKIARQNVQFFWNPGGSGELGLGLWKHRSRSLCWCAEVKQKRFSLLLKYWTLFPLSLSSFRLSPWIESEITRENLRRGTKLSTSWKSNFLPAENQTFN